MLTIASNPSAELAAKLLTHYSFDLSGYGASELVNHWQREYSTDWLHLAVVEALYQGRYKAVSVQQILAFWQRRGQPTYHFNMEFERLICGKFPESFATKSAIALPPVKLTVAQPQETKAKLLPAKVDYYQENTNHYQENTNTNIFIAKEEEEEKKPTPTPPSFIVSNSYKGQSYAAVSQKPAPSKPTELPEALPAPSNNPPIGQFTPQRSDRSESFTSKLKAMTAI